MASPSASILGIRLMSSNEKDDLRMSLDEECKAITRVLRMQHRLLQAYRCGCVWGESLSKGTMTRELFEDMCAQCALCEREAIEKVRKMEISADIFTTQLQAAGGATDVGDATVDKNPAEIARLEKFRESFQHQRNMDAMEDKSGIIPGWREQTSPSTDGEKGTAPRFNKELSLGTGSRKRHVHSTHAFQNLMGALSGDEPKLAKMVSVEAIKEMFAFVLDGQSDTASFHDFIKLLLMFVRHFFKDDYEESVLRGLERFYMDHVLHFVLDNAMENFQQICERLPIQRFPGMEKAKIMVQSVLQNTFEVFSGGGVTMSKDSFTRLMTWIDIKSMCAASGTVVLQAFNNACRLAIEYAGERQDALNLLPHDLPDAIEFPTFIDAVCLVGHEVFSAEPHKTRMPTMAARFFGFILLWGPWYQQHFSRSLEEDLVVDVVYPPRIESVFPLEVDTRRRSTVVIHGEHFPKNGVYCRFGNQVAISSLVNFDGGSHFVNVDVPPTAADTIEVNIINVDQNGNPTKKGNDQLKKITSNNQLKSADNNNDNADLLSNPDSDAAGGGAGNVDETHLVISAVKYKSVDMSVSTDGRVFYKFKEHEFTYREKLPEFPLQPSLSKLRRIFSNYCSLGDKSNTTLLKHLQWKKFTEDFRLVSEDEKKDRKKKKLNASTRGKQEEDDEKKAEEEQAELDAAERAAPFLKFSEMVSAVTDELILEGDGSPKPKKVRALTFRAFIKAIAYITVSNTTTLEEGFQTLLDNDQWIGRDLLPDVPESHRGEKSLRVRRAATGMNIRKYPNQMPRANSPRGGNDPITEVGAIHAIDEESGTAPRSSPALPMIDMEDMPKGGWVAEHKQEMLILEFLTKGEAELEAQTLQYIRRLKESSRGNSPVEEEEYPSMSASLAATPTAASMLTPTARRDPAPSPSNKTSAFAALTRKSNAALDEQHMKNIVRLNTQEMVNTNQRELFNTVCRREADEKMRHQRQVRRLQEQLEEERKEKAEAMEQLEKHHLSKKNKEEQLEIFNSSDGVLQAEKEELQKLFIQELEKKKLRMDADRAREDNLLDLERDRQVSQLREQMQHADHMFGRLQDTVKAQSQVMEQQTAALRMIKNRSNLFKVDGQFFRETHDQLVAVVDKSKHRDLLGEIEEGKHKHDEAMEAIATQMLQEAKTEGRKTVQSTKDLLQKKPTGKKFEQPAHPLIAEGRELAAEKNGFVLPDVPEVLVTVTQDEADKQAQEAVEEAERRKETEMEELRHDLNNVLAVKDVQMAERERLLRQEFLDHMHKMQVAALHTAAGNKEAQAAAINAAVAEAHAHYGGGTPAVMGQDIKNTPQAASLQLDSPANLGQTAAPADSPPTFDADGNPMSPPPIISMGDSIHDGTSMAALGGFSPMRTPNPQALQQTGLAMPTSHQSGVLYSPSGPMSPSHLSQQFSAASGAMSPGGVGDATSFTVATPQSGQAGLIPMIPMQQGGNVVYMEQSPMKDCATTEVQTDTPRMKRVKEPSALDEYAKFFGKTLDIIHHELKDDDTVESIATLYGVEKLDILRANFLVPPASSDETPTQKKKKEPKSKKDDELGDSNSMTTSTLNATEATQEENSDDDDAATADDDPNKMTDDEMTLALRGIPSRKLRIPVPLGAKQQYETIAKIKLGEVAEDDEEAQLILSGSPTGGFKGPFPTTTSPGTASLVGSGSTQAEQELLSMSSRTAGRRRSSVSPRLNKSSITPDRSATPQQLGESEEEDNESASQEKKIRSNETIVDDDEEDEEDEGDRVVYGEDDSEDEDREALLEKEIAKLRAENAAHTQASNVNPDAIAGMSDHAQSLKAELQAIRAEVQDMPAKVVGEFSSQILMKISQMNLQSVPAGGQRAGPGQRRGGAKGKKQGLNESIGLTGSLGMSQTPPGSPGLMSASEPDSMNATNASGLSNGLIFSKSSAAGNTTASGAPVQAHNPAFRASSSIQRVVYNAQSGRHKVVKSGYDPADFALPTDSAGEMILSEVPPSFPPEVSSTMPLDPIKADSLVVTPAITRPLRTDKSDSHKGRLGNEFLLDTAARQLLQDELLHRLSIVSQAEQFFDSMVTKHKHMWTVYMKKRSEERLFGAPPTRGVAGNTAFGTSLTPSQKQQLAQASPSGSPTLVGVDGKKSNRHQVKLTQRQIEERNIQEATQRRRQEDEQRRKLFKEKKLAQLESRAANAVRLKRMLQEHIAVKHAPAKINYVPKKEKKVQSAPTMHSRLEDAAKFKLDNETVSGGGGGSATPPPQRGFSPPPGLLHASTPPPGGHGGVRLQPMHAKPKLPSKEAQQQMDLVSATDDLLRAHRIQREDRALHSIGVSPATKGFLQR